MATQISATTSQTIGQPSPCPSFASVVSSGAGVGLGSYVFSFVLFSAGLSGASVEVSRVGFVMGRSPGRSSALVSSPGAVASPPPSPLPRGFPPPPASGPFQAGKPFPDQGGSAGAPSGSASLPAWRSGRNPPPPCARSL